LSGKNEEDDFNKTFAEIMKLSNIEDFDSVVKSETFSSIKENILLLNALNELSQEINSIILCIINEAPIDLTDDMQEMLSIIDKLSIDSIDDMIVLNGMVLHFDSYDDEEEEESEEDDDDDY